MCREKGDLATVSRHFYSKKVYIKCLHLLDSIKFNRTDVRETNQIAGSGCFLRNILQKAFGILSEQPPYIA